MDKNYLQVVKALPKEVQDYLTELPETLQPTVKEISLRIQKPITIVTFSGNYFPKNEGGFAKHLPIKPYILSSDTLFNCIKVLTEYSLHSYKNDINSGFFTIKGGHRVGVVGSCIYDELNPKKINSIKQISSLNIRVARQIKGVATGLVKEIFPQAVSSTLIVGAPATGKTTFLRDISCCISNMYSMKVALIDERGELASVYQGVPQNDVGVLTDVYDGYKKGDGMSFAIRTIAPEVILIDEVYTQADMDAIRFCLNSGVSIIATTHAKNERELLAKKPIYRLLAEGAFENIVYLNNKSSYKVTKFKVEV